MGHILVLSCVEARHKYFSVLEARLHFSIIPVLLLANEINIHMYKMEATSLVALDNRP